MQLTIGTHSLTCYDKIKLATDSISFSCEFNGVTQTKTYPRAVGANTTSGADYAYDTWLPVLKKDATTITVNVNGGQGTISHNFAHTFQGAGASGVCACTAGVGAAGRFVAKATVQGAKDAFNGAKQLGQQAAAAATQAWEDTKVFAAQTYNTVAQRIDEGVAATKRLADDTVKLAAEVAKDIDEDAFKDGIEVGVSAQEIEKVFPQAVSEKGLPYLSDNQEEPEKYKTVEYDQLVGLLVQAVKELKWEVNLLKGNS